MTETRKDDVAEELAKLYRKHGRLTPSMVVQAATRPDSPLHDEFEWDNEKASAKYREDQARTLIRSVKVILRTDTVTVRSVAYVRDPTAASDEQGYVSVESLAEDQEKARQALEYECIRATALLERARGLGLALGLAGEVDALLAGLGALRKQIAA